MAKPQTWEERGEYLARCLGMNRQDFGRGLDRAIEEQRQQIASGSTAGTRAAAGQKARKPASATRAKTTAGATN